MPKNNIIDGNANPPEGFTTKDIIALNSFYTNSQPLRNYILNNQPKVYAQNADILDNVSAHLDEKAKEIQSEYGIKATDYLEWQRKAEEAKNEDLQAETRHKTWKANEDAARERRAKGLKDVAP